MDEMAGVRNKLQRSLGQELPDWIWQHKRVRRPASDYLDASSDAERKDCWDVLEEEAGERLAAWNEGQKETLRAVQSGNTGGSEDMREAVSRDTGGEDVGEFDPWRLFSDRTKAMVGAMSALFALIGDQFPKVKEFRENVLGGRLLTADEAHALIASDAARTLDRRLFEEWGIPFVGHHAKIVGTGPRGEHYNPVDDWMTIRVDPPGRTETVRYACPREGDPNTRCMLQSGAVIPIHNYLPVEFHGEHTYRPWLWPGSVVDELYDLSSELADAFDWPGGSDRNLTGTRPWSRTAVWFILTGERPQVRPIEAKWETKRGSTYLNPQWRIQLTIPHWLPEGEALQALRTLKRQRPEGRELPKTVRPLEVARFVWRQEREDGYRKPAPWKVWFERWNEEHPGHRFKTYRNFREYFFRGDAAVRELNFVPPKPRAESPDTT